MGTVRACPDSKRLSLSRLPLSGEVGNPKLTLIYQHMEYEPLKK